MSLRPGMANGMDKQKQDSTPAEQGTDWPAASPQKQTNLTAASPRQASPPPIPRKRPFLTGPVCRSLHHERRPNQLTTETTRALHLADLITELNGFCGVMSIFSSLRYCLGPPGAFGNLWAALAFMPLGLAFDFLDGKVARWRGKASLMGQELDSLADLVRCRGSRDTACSAIRDNPLTGDPCSCPSASPLRCAFSPSACARRSTTCS